VPGTNQLREGAFFARFNVVDRRIKASKSVLHMSGSILDVAVVGGGFAGICASYFLKHFDLDHMVFEKGRVGQAWRNSQWDSLTLKLSNRLAMLPGTPYVPEFPEAFSSASDFLAGIEHYAMRFQLPVSEHSTVLRIEKPEDSPYFELTVYHDNDGERKYYSWRILMAAGEFGLRVVPPFANLVGPDVTQVHAVDFRRPSMLPEGAILVVGSGQSGCEIAEELLSQGRAVYLSTSKTPRLPRSYRGKDAFDWLLEMNSFDTDGTFFSPGDMDPVVSGAGEQGHTINLQGLQHEGAVLLGRMDGISGYMAYFDNSLAENARFADAYEGSFLKAVDDFIIKNRIIAPVHEEPEQTEPIKPPRFDAAPPTLNLMERNVRSIIWATGTEPDYRALGLAAAFSKDGNPIHLAGVSPFEGLFYLGYRNLRSPKSSFLFGIREDASAICGSIYTSIR
jgi:putative flavoprotein involved in K+ transport